MNIFVKLLNLIKLWVILILIFSYFSTEDSFTPINVNSDLILSLFLDFIASEKLENIFGDNKAFSLIKSPDAKEVRILS